MRRRLPAIPIAPAIWPMSCATRSKRRTCRSAPRRWTMRSPAWVRIAASRGAKLDKLILYAKDKTRIELEDIRAIMGDEAEARSEEMCDAAGEGDFRRLDVALERLWVAENQPHRGDAHGHGPFPAPGAGGCRKGARREHRQCDAQIPPADSLSAVPRRSRRKRVAGANRNCWPRSTCCSKRGVVQNHSRARASRLRGVRFSTSRPWRADAQGPHHSLSRCEGWPRRQGVNFVNLRDAGDPVEQAMVYGC